LRGKLIQAKTYELRAIDSCRIKADGNNYDRPNVSALDELAYEPDGPLGPEPLEAALVVEINP
jgi:hypothetical protein